MTHPPHDTPPRPTPRKAACNRVLIFGWPSYIYFIPMLEPPGRRGDPFWLEPDRASVCCCSMNQRPTDDDDGRQHRNPTIDKIYEFITCVFEVPLKFPGICAPRVSAPAHLNNKIYDFCVWFFRTLGVACAHMQSEQFTPNFITGKLLPNCDAS